MPPAPLLTACPLPRYSVGASWEAAGFPHPAAAASNYLPGRNEQVRGTRAALPHTLPPAQLGQVWA